jgi:hypothetical protein
MSSDGYDYELNSQSRPMKNQIQFRYIDSGRIPQKAPPTAASLFMRTICCGDHVMATDLCAQQLLAL